MFSFIGPVGRNIWWEHSRNGSFGPKNLTIFYDKFYDTLPLISDVFQLWDFGNIVEGSADSSDQCKMHSCHGPAEEEVIRQMFHIGPQTILVTNLVTNSVTNLSPNLVITKQSDKFVTKFVTDIGVHQIW